MTVTVGRGSFFKEVTKSYQIFKAGLDASLGSHELQCLPLSHTDNPKWFMTVFSCVSLTTQYNKGKESPRFIYMHQYPAPGQYIAGAQIIVPTTKFLGLGRDSHYNPST